MQLSKPVRGTKKDAQRLAAQLALRPSPAAGRRTVDELLDDYVKHKTPTWAIQTRADHRGRVKQTLADPISKMAVARVSVRDVDACVLRMRVGRHLLVTRAGLEQLLEVHSVVVLERT